jgi:hypothetical protein
MKVLSVWTTEYRALWEFYIYTSEPDYSKSTSATDLDLYEQSKVPFYATT